MAAEFKQQMAALGRQAMLDHLESRMDERDLLRVLIAEVRGLRADLRLAAGVPT